MPHGVQPTAAPPGPPRADTGLLRASSALRSGDAARACRLLEAEVRRNHSNVDLRLQLATLKEATGDRDGAARELTRALRFDPKHARSAQRLGSILAQGRVAPDAGLDHDGLAACLQHRTVDRELIGAAALDVLCQDGPLRQALAQARTQGLGATALGLLARRSSPLVRDPLLLAVLTQSTVTSHEVERLLTALRRALLLDIPRARLAEADLARFATALAAQCWSNEYVYTESDAERAHLAGPPPSVDAVLAGDGEAGRDHLMRALYRDPLVALPASTTAKDASHVVPKAFSTFLQGILTENSDIRAYADALPRLGIIADATSLKVKAQYEASPYPRWRGTALYPDGQFHQYLETFFRRSDLDFLNAQFEVLIAGCGTGWQAVSAALDYGVEARVTGLDISSASLGYAALMARRLDAGNLTLALGDIERIATFDPAWTKRYKVIECCGVLHHMADPFAAWRGLLDCLAPGGIMLVGLYSATARRDLMQLRAEPDYPGPGCDDAELRAYRHRLLGRTDNAPGTRYLASRDAFTASGFRDFFLHVSEKPTTIAEIQTFLDANALAFRGFVNAPFGLLRKRFPDEAWPGRLDRWADLEAEQPLLFIGMYQFWVTRR